MKITAEFIKKHWDLILIHGVEDLLMLTVIIGSLWIWSDGKVFDFYAWKSALYIYFIDHKAVFDSVNQF